RHATQRVPRGTRGRERPASRGNPPAPEGPAAGRKAVSTRSPREARGAPAHSALSTQHSALVFGRWPVLEALRAGDVRVLYMAAGLRGETRREVEAEAAERRVPVREVSRDELERELPGRNHQGIAAECVPYTYATLSEIVAAGAPSPE